MGSLLPEATFPLLGAGAGPKREAGNRLGVLTMTLLPVEIGGGLSSSGVLGASLARAGGVDIDVDAAGFEILRGLGLIGS
jgi:hypothetical protein